VAGPGRYVVLHNNTAVTAGLVAAPPILKNLRKGAVITVSEVRHCPQDMRVRGYVEDLGGWLSLIDTSDGYRWAVPHGAPTPVGLPAAAELAEAEESETLPPATAEGPEPQAPPLAALETAVAEYAAALDAEYEAALGKSERPSEVVERILAEAPLLASAMSPAPSPKVEFLLPELRAWARPSAPAPSPVCPTRSLEGGAGARGSLRALDAALSPGADPCSSSAGGARFSLSAVARMALGSGTSTGANAAGGAPGLAGEGGEVVEEGGRDSVGSICRKPRAKAPAKTSSARSSVMCQAELSPAILGQNPTRPGLV